MGIELRRKLYRRGSSFETTIPMPMLFKLDLEHGKHDVVFRYDEKTGKWYLDVEARPEKPRRGGQR